MRNLIKPLASFAMLVCLLSASTNSFALRSEVVEGGDAPIATHNVRVGDFVWVSNLCKRVTVSGPFELISLEAARSKCPPKRDYSEVEKAYGSTKTAFWGLSRCDSVKERCQKKAVVCTSRKGYYFDGKLLVTGLCDGTRFDRDRYEGCLAAEGCL